MASRSDGPLRAYRVGDVAYPLFDGGGAARFGGRWNSPGRPVIYGALCYANSLLEKLIRLAIGTLPKGEHAIVIDVPGGVMIEEITAADLPGWNARDLVASRAYGDGWFDERRTAVLVVPAVAGQPHERNILINPQHAAFGRIRASRPEPIVWDARLFDR